MDDILKQDALAFLNSDEFAETVIYRNASGITRHILAVVDRHPPTMIPDAKGVTPHFLLTVANSITKGITPQELNKGTDSIEVKEKAGDETYTTMKIRLIERQDAGTLLLQVR